MNRKERRSYINDLNGIIKGSKEQLSVAHAANKGKSEYAHKLSGRITGLEYALDSFMDYVKVIESES